MYIIETGWQLAPYCCAVRRSGTIELNRTAARCFRLSTRVKEIKTAERFGSETNYGTVPVRARPPEQFVAGCEDCCVWLLYALQYTAENLPGR
jgi:hypothetical protein